MRLQQSRIAGFIYIVIIYGVAAVIGIRAFHLVASESLLIRVFWADIAATLFVYCAGLVVGNASVYDPYWSVAPMVILVALPRPSADIGAYCLILVICFWGIRLTLNWAYTFKGLHQQDWRYDRLHAWSPRLFPLVSLTGIHLFPTLVVFLALMPAVVFLADSTLNALTVLGLLISVSAALLQLVADLQMQRFRRRNMDPGRIMTEDCGGMHATPIIWAKSCCGGVSIWLCCQHGRIDGSLA